MNPDRLLGRADDGPSRPDPPPCLSPFPSPSTWTANRMSKPTTKSDRGYGSIAICGGMGSTGRYGPEFTTLAVVS
jgi:hypothetical protein